MSEEKESISVQSGAVNTGGGKALGERAVDVDGSVYGGIRTGDVYYGSDSVDWSRDDLYTAYLRSASNEFSRYIQQFSGTNELDIGIDSYRPLLMQTDVATTTEIEINGRKETNANRVSDTFEALFNKLNDHILIVGDAGSGKSTELYYRFSQEAQQAEKDEKAPLPLLVSLRGYQGGKIEEFVVRQTTNLSKPIILALWKKPRRPILFLLDGLDEVDVKLLNRSIQIFQRFFEQAKANGHRVILTSRPDAAARFANTPSLARLNLLPLSDDQIEQLIKAYRIQTIGERFFELRLNTIFKTPDIISALAHASVGRDAVPLNLGQIYQLYVDETLFRSGADTELAYDYKRVIRPILGEIAFNFVANEHNEIVYDDDLIDQLYERLSKIDSRFERRIEVLPLTWLVSDFVNVLTASPVFSLNETGREKRLYFSKPSYRDYFAAVHIISLQGGLRDFDAVFTPDRRNQWLQPLLMLAGIASDERRLLDRLFVNDPVHSADIWIDVRTVNIQPLTVLKEYADSLQARTAFLLSQTMEKYTEALYAGLLSAETTTQEDRLKIINALSQQGIIAIPFLLKAAKNQNPFIRASAYSSLIRMGEEMDGRPIPPLFEISGHRLIFRSNGGCRGSFHSINLSQGLHLPGEISLTIETMPIDPFSAACDLVIELTPIEQIIAEWFQNRGLIDWVGLLEHFKKIVATSQKIINEAEKETNLAFFVEQQQKRFDTIQAQAHLLSNALGFSTSEWLADDVGIRDKDRKFFNALLQLYGRGGRSYRMGDRTIKDDIVANVDQTVGLVERGGKIIGVQAKHARVEDVDGNDPMRSVHLEVNQEIDRLKGHTRLFEIEKMEMAGWQLPYNFQLEGNVKVRQIDNGTLDILHIGESLNKGGGVYANFNILIEKLDDNSQVTIISTGSDIKPEED